MDYRTLLHNGLVTAALSCAIALALTLSGQGAWDVQLVYSLAIGLTTWLVIDLGRQALATPKGQGWPAPGYGALLVAGGIATGYSVGSLLGDAYSGHALPLWQRQELPTALVISVVAGVSISYFFHSAFKARHLQLQIVQAQRDAAQARLKLLEAQLEPHMLFNTLANLRVLLTTDPLRAQTMLDHLIDYLRATLGGSRATLHPLADEFARLHDYLALIAVRMGQRLHYALELPPSLHAALVPPLLLQPLVENAIRHGIEPQVHGGHITVRASLESAGHTPYVRLEVLDTGCSALAAPSIKPSQAGAHFGLAQVRERLATLYGAEGTIELIAATAGYTCARVQFPLKTFPHDPFESPRPDC